MPVMAYSPLASDRVDANTNVARQYEAVARQQI